MEFDPAAYRRWFSSPLGRTVDADEQAMVAALAALRPGERVLDLGCGDGAFTEPAARVTGDVVGLDASPAMLEAAAARLAHLPGIAWVRGDAAALPFPDASFDAVLAVAMLGGVPDPLAVLREARRVLRPGGRIVLADLNRWSSWAAERRVRGWLQPSRVWSGARFFSERELRGLLGRAGFVDLDARGVVYYPPVDHPRLLRLFRPIESVGVRLRLPGAALCVVRANRPPHDTPVTVR